MSASIALSGKSVEAIYNDQWDRFSKSVSPDLQFLNRCWFSTWEQDYLPSLNPDSHIKYISLFDSCDNMHGTFPYVEFSRFGLKILSMAGLYYPFRSILFSAEIASDCANAFVTTIHESYRNSIIRIGPTVEDELANKIIKGYFLDLGWKCYQMDRGKTNIICLPNSIDEYHNILGKKYIKNIRRSERNLGKLGEVRCERFNNCDPEVWADVIDRCAKIEKRSWLASDDDAEMRIAENRDYWKHYLEFNDASQRAVIWLVSLDGEPIAYSFSIDSGDCRYSFSGHYDEEFKKYGPGIIVDRCMYEDAITSGIKTIDMGWGEADYKDRWGAKPGSRITDYIYFPPNMIGQIAYSGLKLKSLISR